MDLRRFLLNNATLQSRPKRRRHSIADVRFLHTLKDIPERPLEEEDYEKERRRRSTGSLEKDERQRSASEPSDSLTTQCCDEDTLDMSQNPSKFVGDTNGSIDVSRNPSTYIMDTQSPMDANDTKDVPSRVDDKKKGKPRCNKRSTSVEEEHVIEAVSTYVLSYTDDAGNIIGTDEVSPSTTGSSSPQGSSKETTSDEELALSEMLRKIETQTPMTTSRSRRGSMIDPVLVERITSLTPIVESSRSSSVASVLANPYSFEMSPENSNGIQENDHGSNDSFPKNDDIKQEMLRRILVSPRLTRRGSLSDLLNSLSLQIDITADSARQNIKKSPTSQSNHLLPQMHAQVKDPWRPLSPLNVKVEHDERLKLRKKSDCPRKENGNVLGRIMNSPTLLRRRGPLGDVLRSLSPNVSGSPSRGYDKEKCLLSAADRQNENDIPNKDKDGRLGRIVNSPCLTRRGSIGNILNAFSPTPNRKSPSPSPFVTKCNAEDHSSKSKLSVGSGVLKSKDAARSSGTPGPKGLLAIVQKHVMNHTQALQRRRRNSIASTTPHTGALEISLRGSFDAEKCDSENKLITDCKSRVRKTTVPGATENSLSYTNSKSNSSSNSNNSNVNKSSGEVVTRSPCGHSIPSKLWDGSFNTSIANDHSKPKKTSQTSDSHDLISPVPKRLIGSESVDVPRVQSEFPSVETPQRKLSAPVSPKSVDYPQKKINVTIIKRTPVTFVISNDEDRKNELRRNGEECQVPNNVSFMNSRFLPLNQDQAEEYSMMKEEEASKLSSTTVVNSTVTMSSRATVHGGSGSIPRKIGTAVKNKDSLPTDERFAALSERYASLKAKIEGNDAKQKNQDSPPEESPKFVESRDRDPNNEEMLIQPECWTTVESIPVKKFQNNVSAKRVDELFTKPEKTLMVEGDNEQEENRQENADFDIDRMGFSTNPTRTVSSVYGIEKDASIDENNRINSSSITNNNKPEIREENGDIRINSKTALDLRPESPANKTGKTVVSKLMNRKMGIRRKHSIVPRVTKRRSKVYEEYCSTDSGIPTTATQFEEIRTLVEGTVLRAPVRQEVR